MRPSAQRAAFDSATARRLVLAVAASAAFHAIVLGGLRAGTPNSLRYSGVPIEARIAAGGSIDSSETPYSTPTLGAGTTATGETSTNARASAIDEVRTSGPLAAVAIEARPALDPASRTAAPASAAPKSASRAKADAAVNTTSAAEARIPQAAASTAPDATPGAQLPSSVARLPFAPDTTYYTIAALDRLPAPLAAPDACYPRGATGEVTYELLIDETGVVNQATVLEVSPAELATAAAVERCSAIRFSPAIKGGRSVRSKVRFVVGRS